MRTGRAALLGAVLVGSLAGAPPSIGAQLLSPGRLAAPHAELEGLRGCVSCHALGRRGIDPERCLACHEAVATRIAERRGYHASLVADSCADCHQDHLGPRFDLLHLDEESFLHEDTGYALELAHAAVDDCRACHTADNVTDAAVVAFKGERGSLARTYLGLSTECAQCHGDESPHGDQFGRRGCADCHDEGEWEAQPGFDHGATAFPLEGLHAQVACADCHGSPSPEAVYRPLRFQDCGDCHADPHDGAMTATCASCHRTDGWEAVSTTAVQRGFDHAATSFPLAGAHAAAACQACHQPGRPPSTEVLRMRYARGTERASFPRPLAESCASCHLPRHTAPETASRWRDCEACHSDLGWAPSPYDVARHAEASFVLTGAHVVTPCVACHQDPDRGQAAFTLRLPDQSCAGCHEADDPHEGRYGALACSDCHDADTFEHGRFDHALLPDLEERSCASCHSLDDPHAGQFPGRDCGACHVTGAFTAPDFDHARTRFPLEGAHAGTGCASCHAPAADLGGAVRYTPLGADCVDCHGGAT